MGGRSARESIVSLYGGRHPIRILALYGKAVVGGLGGGNQSKSVIQFGPRDKVSACHCFLVTKIQNLHPTSENKRNFTTRTCETHVLMSNTEISLQVHRKLICFDEQQSIDQKEKTEP